MVKDKSAQLDTTLLFNALRDDRQPDVHSLACGQHVFFLNVAIFFFLFHTYAVRFVAFQPTYSVCI